MISFNRNTEIDFIGKRKIALGFSLGLIFLSITSLFIQGLNLGIDFSGGYLIEAGYSEAVSLPAIRKSMIEAGFKNSQIQHYGTAKEVLVRLGPQKGINQAELSSKVMSVLKSVTDQSVNMRRIEFVGPQIGDELREQGGLAMLIALFGILIYIGIRFQLKSSAGAIFALIHDVIITIGVFSVTQMEFDLTVLAAILAVIGYSLNDTVVVLDRIRETFTSKRKETVKNILNISINQTLSRTLVTSLTTLIVLITLYLFGGPSIHGFAFALTVGVVIGTYSSIYVASSTLVMMNICKEDFFQELAVDPDDNL
ncbi:MAG: protein translocase subunit SecF [Methylococcales bacterium]